MQEMLVKHFNGFRTQCDLCGRKTWYEQEQQCYCEYPKKETCDSCGHSETVEPLKMERCKGTLRLIDYSELDPRFLDYFESGQRIEITYEWGETERCYVGKSTGYKPIWLLIRKKNSFGGEALMPNKITAIKELQKWRA